jgi:hypothetical protein
MPLIGINHWLDYSKLPKGDVVPFFLEGFDGV